MGSLTLNVFKEYEYISFLSEIEILNEYDNKGNIIGISVEDEWSAYLKENPIKKAVKSAKSIGSVKKKCVKKKEMKKENKIQVPMTEKLTQKQKQKIEDVRVWLRNEMD